MFYFVVIYYFIFFLNCLETALYKDNRYYMILKYISLDSVRNECINFTIMCVGVLLFYYICQRRCSKNLKLGGRLHFFLEKYSITVLILNILPI